jgi:hypothetical protein
LPPDRCLRNGIDRRRGHTRRRSFSSFLAEADACSSPDASFAEGWEIQTLPHNLKTRIILQSYKRLNPLANPWRPAMTASYIATTRLIVVA